MRVPIGQCFLLVTEQRRVKDQYVTLHHGSGLQGVSCWLGESVVITTDTALLLGGRTEVRSVVFSDVVHVCVCAGTRTTDVR